MNRTIINSDKGIFRGYRFKPPNEFFTVKKPELYKNRAKFNPTPKPNPPTFFSGYAPEFR